MKSLFSAFFFFSFSSLSANGNFNLNCDVHFYLTLSSGNMFLVNLRGFTHDDPRWCVYRDIYKYTRTKKGIFMLSNPCYISVPRILNAFEFIERGMFYLHFSFLNYWNRRTLNVDYKASAAYECITERSLKRTYWIRSWQHFLREIARIIVRSNNWTIEKEEYRGLSMARCVTSNKALIIRLLLVG
jgi:hypothetical protein